MTLKAHRPLGIRCWSSAAVVVLALACSESNEAADGDAMGLGKDASAPAAQSGTASNTASGSTSPNESAPNSESSSPAASTTPPEPTSSQPVGSDDTDEPGVDPAPEESSPEESSEETMEPAPESSESVDETEPAPESSDEGDDTAPPEPSEPAPEDPSAGCAAGANPPVGVQTLDVDGTERSYIVSLPEDYDPTLPYPLVFAFHGLGGSAELVSGRYYFGLEEPGGKPTVFVYPDGLDAGDGAGWANTDGQDVAFFDALFAKVQQTYCIDSARVFSTGHSYGGIMTHTLACQRADVLRAIAPVAGAFFGGRGGECSGPVAAWGAHGNPDNTVDYESGVSAIERVMETNGCDPESGTPVEPTEFCVRYECDSDYPVTWCAHDEDHNWPEFASESIKAFFDGF